MKQLILTPIFITCASILSLTFLVEAAYADLDRDATAQEREQVVQSLKSQGCIYVEDVDFIQGIGYEAEDVVCNDGKKYDIILDNNFRVISQREDRD